MIFQLRSLSLSLSLRLFGFLVHQVPASYFLQQSLARTNLSNRMFDQLLLGLQLPQLLVQHLSKIIHARYLSSRSNLVTFR